MLYPKWGNNKGVITVKPRKMYVNSATSLGRKSHLQYYLCSQLQQVFSQKKRHKYQGKQQFQCGQPAHKNMTLMQRHKHGPANGGNGVRN